PCISPMRRPMSRPTAASPERLQTSHSACSAKLRTIGVSSRRRSYNEVSSPGAPRRAIHRTPSARRAASGLPSAASASSREFIVCGNAGAATSVNVAVSRILTRESTMKAPIFIIAALLAPTFVLAAGDRAPKAANDPVLERFSAAPARQDWPAAQAIVRDAVSANPDNPDYHNLYAYSIRKGAN